MIRSRLVVALMMLLASCSGNTIEVSDFAIGVDGPEVNDETGLITDWQLLGPDEYEAGFRDRSGRYTGEFGIDTTTLESTEIIVSWFALPCQDSPVAEVTSTDRVLHIDVTPGPSPEDCAAMSVPYALRLRLSEPLGNRTVSATPTDPVARQTFDHIQP